LDWPNSNKTLGLRFVAGADSGSECDLLAAKKFGKHSTVGTKFTSHDADNTATDTDKYWARGEVLFSP
jgi:hypothetical protein